jgi:hypothetical protein
VIQVNMGSHRGIFIRKQTFQIYSRMQIPDQEREHLHNVTVCNFKFQGRTAYFFFTILFFLGVLIFLERKLKVYFTVL